MSNLDDTEDTEVQLWIMIKTEELFRSAIHLQIEEELAELIENHNLGILDGHSSGAYQFDMNFYKVTNFEKAKEIISNYLESNYPKIQFVISNKYESTFDQL